MSQSVKKIFNNLERKNQQIVSSPCPTTASTHLALHLKYQMKAESCRVVVEAIFRTQNF